MKYIQAGEELIWLCLSQWADGVGGINWNFGFLLQLLFLAYVTYFSVLKLCKKYQAHFNKFILLMSK